jgi:hypothetical protein
MTNGPLEVSWGVWTLEEPRAGTASVARVELENTGTIAWNETVLLSYHWLDTRDNPIVWDGYRTPLPPVAPGERLTVEARVRAPLPPGRYRFSPDLVVEHRAWASELGSPLATSEVDVLPRRGHAHAELPDWVVPAEDWHDRVAAAHAEGYAVVAGTIEWLGGFSRRRPHELEPYAPGRGRVSGFSHPLLCPSVLDGIELERLSDVAGLPAFAAPIEETWIYDGRIVLRAYPRARGRL